MDSIKRPSASRDVNWHRGLPILRDETVLLRELETSDARPLFAHISTPGVVRFIAAPPASVEAFKRFIRWTHMQRRRGTHICFGVVPAGQSTPVGLFEIWAVEPDFATAECGFVLGESAWGTGLFAASARLVLDFAFGRLGVTRLEMRCAEANQRGNGALRKLGATREATHRPNAGCCGTAVDQVWSILADAWNARRPEPDGAA